MAHNFFVIPPPTRKFYCEIFFLSEICQKLRYYPASLKGQNKILREFAHALEKKQLAKIEDNYWEGTTEGHKVLEHFYQRYEIFLKKYDVFCGVDLHSKEFAVSYMDPRANPKAWEDFLSQDRWEDLRIAVAEREGYDAVEMVFMSFLKDGYFGRDETGFLQEECLWGGIWEDIAQVCHRTSSLVQNFETIIPQNSKSKDLIAEIMEVKNQLFPCSSP